jgi:hypothetical protein
MVVSVLHKVSMKPAAEQLSSVEHGGWQTVPMFVLQMSPPEQSPSPEQ